MIFHTGLLFFSANVSPVQPDYSDSGSKVVAALRLSLGN